MSGVGYRSSGLSIRAGGGPPGRRGRAGRADSIGARRAAHGRRAAARRLVGCGSHGGGRRLAGLRDELASIAPALIEVDQVLAELAGG